MWDTDPRFKDQSFSELKEQGRDPPSAEAQKEETRVVTDYKMTRIPRTWLLHPRGLPWDQVPTEVQSTQTTKERR